jgi:hypothetical protein
MTYDEVEVGQKVKINLKARGNRNNEGTVKAKEILTIGGREVERVYVDTTAPLGRRLCSPTVLEPLG